MEALRGKSTGDEKCGAKTKDIAGKGKQVLTPRKSRGGWHLHSGQQTPRRRMKRGGEEYLQSVCRIRLPLQSDFGKISLSHLTKTI